MSDHQANKTLITEFYKEFDSAPVGRLGAVMSSFCENGYRWRGMHPFNEISGAEETAARFWEPLRSSITRIQRRPDIFMAGSNTISEVGGSWVCCMGHLMGLFDKDWLGIPATWKMAFLRFVEFHEVAAGRIRQSAMFFDIPGVMRQAGLQPFPPETGAWFITPGPKTHGGLLYEPQDDAESAETLSLINRMIDDLVSSDMESPQDELKRTWHDDMIWFGPAGIGATYTCERYQVQHQGPFGTGLGNIQFLGHVCRFAEGKFGGFFGWPNLTMKPTGGFMGFPASANNADMRVVDLYRRENGLLAENWIFIDLLHFYAQQGIDIIGRMKRICGT